MRKHSVVFASYQRGERVADTTQVYLLDAMGELVNFYAASDVAFVGGSLKPFGGQNTLEPAGLGIPIIVGPDTHNFTDINRKLENAGALRTVVDVEQLARVLVELSSDSNQRDKMGQSARSVFFANSGAVEQVEQILMVFLRGTKQ
ncbi:MAG: glycosyltransferase [Pseudomonadota bacterium]